MNGPRLTGAVPLKQRIHHSPVQCVTVFSWTNTNIVAFFYDLDERESTACTFFLLALSS